MSRREDQRSIATRILQAVAKVLIVTALGMGLTSLLGDIGIPARVLGILGALAVSGTAVVASDYAAQVEKRREEERRAVELEDRCGEAFVAEKAAEQLLDDLADGQLLQEESRFAQFVDEQRQRSASRQRGV